MAKFPRLSAEVRTEFGKGAARRARRAGKIPAVLYGHGTDPVHLALPAHDTFLAIKGTTNAILTIDVEGDDSLALVKDVQVDPIRREMDHLDLILVKRGEKVTVDVPIVTEGETAPDTIHTVELQVLSVTVDAIAIPDFITVNIEGMEDGTVVTVADLDVPEGSEVEADPETTVVVVSYPQMDVETDADEADEAEEAEGEEAGDSEEESSEE